ncbi:nucleotidyl transferase AbiEii/AbiGii toxin family protein [Sporichthya sp.]|uniref:nucleotidyl transferase AbiEii/AbiGii toxin family protein n=1 Tax=Sporichthya sp. TaxID=65475 RepID=UPI0025E2AE79|nr:nucleotidyl transferase AbiEii/AbiGii toxin family protein [Sporichthya sp.]
MYALEGFLDRLSVSNRAGDMVLKGGVLLAAYGTRRPTRDVDLHTAASSNDTATVLRMVREIAGLGREDGLAYDTAGASARTIRDEDEYSGVRVKLTCVLASAVIPFDVDVNVGDAVWPVPGPVEVPRLLGGSITVLGYSLPMVFAEKIVTAVQRGDTSTRWRDFADIYLLSGRHNIDGTELDRSLRTVAEHRGARMAPLGVLLASYRAIGQTKWVAWVRKQRLTDRLPENFADVLDAVIAFADPAISGHATGQVWDPARRSWQR